MTYYASWQVHMKNLLSFTILTNFQDKHQVRGSILGGARHMLPLPTFPGGGQAPRSPWNDAYAHHHYKGVKPLQKGVSEGKDPLQCCQFPSKTFPFIVILVRVTI